MKMLRNIVDDIHDELKVAQHYAILAMEHKNTNREAADKYAEMAKQEMSHAEKLHDMAEKYIEKHTVDGAAPPVAMKTIWDWEWEKLIKCMGKARALLDLYRE